jgi:hypothetical protein
MAQVQIDGWINGPIDGLSMKWSTYCVREGREECGVTDGRPTGA